MGTKTMHEKMRLKANQTIAALNAPADFERVLKPLPSGVKIIGDVEKSNFIYWFVKTQKEMEKQLPRILEAMNDDTLVWIFFPKGTSGIQTDLTRDKGWDTLMQRDDLRWVSMISYDDTWTAFAMRKKTEQERKKQEKPQERLIFQYADSKTKTLRLPDDMKTALSKNIKALQAFDALSFSNRREYVEWIITAKKDETRQARLSGMIERLLKGWKNPAGRN